MKRNITPPSITALRKGEVFVFGSNEAGIHGAGAARDAWEHFGAIIYQGYGLQGRSFGIPTKDGALNTLPLPKIKEYVNQFIEEAHQNPNIIYLVTPIGCGLAGWKPENIAPLFELAPKNVSLPESFINVLNK